MTIKQADPNESSASPEGGNETPGVTSVPIRTDGADAPPPTPDVIVPGDQHLRAFLAACLSNANSPHGVEVGELDFEGGLQPKQVIALKALDVGGHLCQVAARVARGADVAAGFRKGNVAAKDPARSKVLRALGRDLRMGERAVQILVQVAEAVRSGRHATEALVEAAKQGWAALYEVARGGEKKEKPEKARPGDVIETRWMGLGPTDIQVASTNHHLDPKRLQRDLLDGHAPPDLSLRAAKPATEMLTTILQRLRDQGHWEAARHDAIVGIRDLYQILCTVDGNAASIVTGMVAQHCGDLEGLFDSAEAAAKREQERLMGLAYEEEANDPKRQEAVVREIHEAMTWPMTTGEIGDKAAKTVGATVAPERVKKALDGKPKWALDGDRWHPPQFDTLGLDEDEQKRIAKENGWVDHIEERARRARIRQNRRNLKVKPPVRGAGWVRRGDSVRLLSEAKTSAGEVVEAGVVGCVNHISGGNAEWVGVRFSEGREVNIWSRDLGAAWEFADAATAKKRAGKTVGVVPPVKSDPKRRTSILIKYGGAWSRYWAPSVSAVYATLPSERFHVTSVAPRTKSPVPSGPNTMVITVEPPDDALRERVREIATAGMVAHIKKIEDGKAARKAERASTKVRAATKVDQ